MFFNFFIWLAEHPTRADNAHEHIDPGIRMGDIAVMLSAAKYLSAQRDRPFASRRRDSGGADFIIRLLF